MSRTTRGILVVLAVAALLAGGAALTHGWARLELGLLAIACLLMLFIALVSPKDARKDDHR